MRALIHWNQAEDKSSRELMPRLDLFLKKRTRVNDRCIDSIQVIKICITLPRLKGAKRLTFFISKNLNWGGLLNGIDFISAVCRHTSFTQIEPESEILSQPMGESKVVGIN